MTKRVKENKSRAGFAVPLARLTAAAALILLGLGWPRLLAGQSALVERCFSESAYQTIRRAIAAVTSLAPFSVAEFLLYALCVGVAALLTVRLVQILCRRIAFSRLLGTLASILLMLGVILNAFYATWGFNYFRAPLAERMGLDVTTRSVDELEAFVRRTADEARALRETLQENAYGVFDPVESDEALFSKLAQAYESLSRSFSVFQPDPTPAKRVVWSRALSWQGISGIYIGLTAEPNVNADQPSLLLYQAAAHEMAHQIGIASENEAELTGYLACRYSDDPNIRYSGLAYALIVAGNALCNADSARYLAVCETYGDAI